MSTVTIKDVVKAFGPEVVIKKFNAEIKDGEFITLLGPSGCGKTTLLRMIAGFHKQTSGAILIDGNVVSDDKVFLPPERRGIGMVFQTYAVWPHMNVFDNVAYPLKILKMSREQIRKDVESILEVVHLGQYKDRMPSQLSGGQQQRVALGRALVAKPKLLLLDEPLSNLDAKLRESMRFEIKEIQKRLGITVVYVTHDQVEAMTMSDRVFLMNNGVVQQVGSPLEIYCHPVNQFVANFVGKANFLKGTVKDGRLFLKGTEQSIAYGGDKTGDVVLTLRPENVKIVSDGGDLTGTLKTIYYLGNENDCQIDIGGGISVRVISDPHAFDNIGIDQKINLKLMDSLVYADDGTNDSYNKILT
ncbi:ABC transporter ATP-binding protein [Treponema parvum]|uniref:ABC transporter ATP-binding protein n=1 Tax=Treponema parvum TaxID=138851 RepID=A0A975ICZ3_9SPIR|nr:ABC transporter ATP-binding protein [Treponema parvum]QTQ11609.1 ABC transporter ATP-binding protein [Treponema parvum]